MKVSIYVHKLQLLTINSKLNSVNSNIEFGITEVVPTS